LSKFYRGGDQPLSAESLEAVLGWIRAAAVYARYGGRPCDAVRAIGGAARAAGLSAEAMIAAYEAAYAEMPTPYVMGWVARLLTEPGARLADYDRPFAELGDFDQRAEYRHGWRDAQRAAATILGACAPDDAQA